MDEKQLQALANERAKNLKTPDDLNQFDRLLKTISVEVVLNAEMTHHLGYDKNQPKPATNARNGYTQKTVITGDGPLELRTPRDRDSSFEPQLAKKNQTRITGMDIPPRKGAGYWSGEYADRNRAVANQRLIGSNARWKWTTDYNRRSIAETAMYRVKQLFGGALTLRGYDGEVAEALAMVPSHRLHASFGRTVSIIPALRDRIVQRAMLMAMEPIWESDFHTLSYGFRTECSVHHAIRTVKLQLTDCGETRGRWVIEGDLSSYFDTVHHRLLMKPAVAYCRYADDFVLIVKGTKAQAETLREECRSVLEGSLKLRLNMDKTRITHVNDGFIFLGHRMIRKRSRYGDLRVVSTIPKEKARNFAASLTALLSGNYSESKIDMVETLNRKLKGWAAFYLFVDFKAKVFSYIDRVVFWKLAHWLARKYRKGIAYLMRWWCKSPKPGQSKTWVLFGKTNHGKLNGEVLYRLVGQGKKTFHWR